MVHGESSQQQNSQIATMSMMQQNSISAFVEIEIYADTRGVIIHILVLQPAIDSLVNARSDRVRGKHGKGECSY